MLFIAQFLSFIYRIIKVYFSFAYLQPQPKPLSPLASKQEIYSAFHQALANDNHSKILHIANHISYHATVEGHKSPRIMLKRILNTIYAKKSNHKGIIADIDYKITCHKIILLYKKLFKLEQHTEQQHKIKHKKVDYADEGMVVEGCEYTSSSMDSSKFSHIPFQAFCDNFSTPRAFKIAQAIYIQNKRHVLHWYLQQHNLKSPTNYSYRLKLFNQQRNTLGG